MKLLIIDDEKLTRESIRDRIPLERLGISHVLLADDGLHGLEKARSFRPDLILTDVRMPRLNGVEMAETILKEFPDTVMIFMSAYSDKEYLKAAIKLKAVSYVEKPLDMEELEAALADGVALCRKRSAAQTVTRLYERDLMGHLVLLLIHGASPQDTVLSLISQLNLPIGPSTCFAALVADCIQPVSLFRQQLTPEMEDAYDAGLKQQGISRLFLCQADRYLINILYAPHRPAPETLRSCAEAFCSLLPEPFHFFLALGPAVTGLDRVSHSFRGAMDDLELGFFQKHNVLLETSSSPKEGTFRAPEDVMVEFTAALTGKNEEQALEAARRLFASIDRSGLLKPSQIKDLYFHYLTRLDEISLSSYILLWQRDDAEAGSIWTSVVDCDTLDQLNQLFCDKIQLYFEQLREKSRRNPLVFQIKEYLHHNYANPTLSVPDISRYVNLSPSYICTLFKSETGQTLNQYLTDYRIKMSKQFLSDPRYKIADISSKVGYSDGNYYSKTFRRLVGLSPSEYREKMLP